MQLALFSTELPVHQDLAAKANSCVDCPLYDQPGGGVAFSDGPISAQVMFVGEAPGENEAKKGKPFVGKAGKLLNIGLRNIGLPRERVYITNVCKHRPAGNRTPTLYEQTACAARFLSKELEIVNPKIIVPLGNPAMKYFLGADKSISRMRGKWGKYNNHFVLPMFHPAYVLRNGDRTEGSPADLSWKDLCELKRALNERIWEE